MVTPRTMPVPPPAIYRPSSKWTVIIAFLVAIALHIAAVFFAGLESGVTTDPGFRGR